MKKILIGALLLTGCALPVMACTGISATGEKY
jgi:choloylglycine hydrolase